MSEWDFVRNTPLLPSEFSHGSKKKVWWKCSIGHSWIASICKRARSMRGCPYCSGNKTDPKESLAVNFPEIARDWHPAKNGSLTAFNVRSFSGRKIWWQCPVADDHKYQCRIADRTNAKSGCPFCRGRLASSTYNLTISFPEISSEFSLNNDKLACDVTPQSIKKYSWLCPKGHEYTATPYDRTRSDGKNTSCPYCSNRKINHENNFEARFPKVANEWDYNKNGELRPNQFFPFSQTKVWWKCKAEHSWKTTISLRSRGTGCRQCQLRGSSRQELLLAFELKIFFDFQIDDTVVFSNSKRYEVDMKIDSNQLIIEFDGAYFHSETFKKDLKKTSTLSSTGWTVVRIREQPLMPCGLNSVTVPSKKKFKSLELWAKSSMDVVLSYFNKAGILPENKINKINKYLNREGLSNLKELEKYEKNINLGRRLSLDSFCRALSDEWDKKRNNLGPHQVTFKSNRKVYWKCLNCKYSFQARVSDRANGSGCPSCAQRTVTPNRNLMICFPHIAGEWSEKNPISAKEVLPHSAKKSWWICDKGHDYQATPNNRVNGSRCPTCYGSSATKYNNLVITNPSLISEWASDNPMSPYDIKKGSPKKIIWECKKGHKWTSTIKSKLKINKCLVCYGLTSSGKRSFKTEYPHIAKEWSDTNTFSSDTITSGSKKKVWWNCSNGHEYLKSILHRKRGQGCPICYREHRKKCENKNSTI